MRLKVKVVLQLKNFFYRRAKLRTVLDPVKASLVRCANAPGEPWG